jgi:hypothetical protein
MAKKPPKDGSDKLRPDMAETAYRTMLEATGQAPKTRPGEGPKNAVAVERGKAGGLKGGKARADKLTGKQLTDIGKKGAAGRWKDHKPAEVCT